MIKIRCLSLFAILLASALSAASNGDSIVGTWVLTAADKLLPDGTRVPDYGSNPHGLAVFSADGHYAVEIYRADRPKLSSNDRTKASLEDYKSVEQRMSVHFGTYTFDPSKHTISFHIDRAGWPDWDETVQVRSYELKGDELSWKVAPRADGSIPITVLRRAK